ncbi:MAG TPA: ATP-binding protein [Candidatus Sulfotelmatobacter sp.]|nr:ATP-binding protein [Candidatus Sulfotelmatobacter sp.]
MKFNMKFRLAALGLAVGLMAALMVFITMNSLRGVADLQTRLNNLDLESSVLADQFRETMHDLNNSVISYGITHDPAAWADCLKQSQKLKTWITEQKFKLRNPSEKKILQQMDSAYGDYLTTIQDFHAKIVSMGRQDSALSDIAPAREKTQQLAGLSRKLVQAHYQARAELLTRAHGTLSNLLMFILVSLGLLFVFGVAVSVEVYRDLIAPLRVKLVESQALAERREKLASLGLLAAGVAHEIRTPLTAIKAALYLQKKKFQAGTSELENVEVVEREILRLERIVNNFIRFARPADPEPAVVNVEDLLLDLQTFFTPQLGEANIQLIMEILAPMRIRADAAQIKQVLINLVQNAADSIGGDGKITLRARPDQKRLANIEKPVVAIEVTDTGKGISPEVEKRLFDPFFTTKENGSGLGLSIAAQIVQKHGGELQYQTLMNHGATFGIILPRLIE